jgi:protein-tyrosine-phosphatase/predicted ATP-grasp superfamily ATP-dependent carboligase
MKNSTRALVLDAHSRAGLETTQSLGRHGVIVDVASEQNDCLAFHSKYAYLKLKQPFPASSNFVEWLCRLTSQNSYDLLVPSTEGSLVGCQSLADEDPLRAQAVLPPRESISIALDKQRTYVLAQQLGVPVPRSRRIDSIGPLLPGECYPVVLKPTHSASFMAGDVAITAPVIATNNRERTATLRRWLSSNQQVLQQEYVGPGHGVGIELLFDRGKKIWHFAHERIHEYPLTGGASTYRRSITPDPRLLGFAESLLKALGWHGPAMVEFRVSAHGQYWLMEINPRLWGSLALSIDAGVNFPLGLLLLASEQPLASQPHYRVGYYTRDLANDIQWQVANLRANRRDPLLLTRPPRSSLIEYLRPMIGCESWDHFDVRDLRPTLLILKSICGRYWHSLRRYMMQRRLRAKALAGHRKLIQHISSASARPHSLLFVCYGNICRSPFAEAVARVTLPSTLEVASAGFHHNENRPCPPNVGEAAAKIGVDMSEARSRRVTQGMVDRADLILVMDLGNYEQLVAEFPDAVPRTTLLGLFGTPGAQPTIADPYGSSADETERVLLQIQNAVTGLASTLGVRADTFDSQVAIRS